MAEPLPPQDASHDDAPSATLTIRDNRTGRSYTVAIDGSTINAVDLRQIRSNEPSDAGLSVYDMGYMNTCMCRSAITYIDGANSMLLYRGYRIEEIAEHCTFLEAAHLVIYGELPTKPQLGVWETRVKRHAFIHENMSDMLKSFRYDSHPMGMVISALAAMNTFHPEANPSLQGAELYQDHRVQNKQILRILGKLPTIAACAYRHRIGRPYNHPSDDLSYCENFLYMMDRLSESSYRPQPELSRIIEKLFILHIDHELNNSTAAMRHVGSTLVDPFTAVACAAGALYGPLHGGASEGALRMLAEIGSCEKIPEFLEGVKAKKRRLIGFGHRVYKSYDPRARVIKQLVEDTYKLLKKRDPLLEIASALEEAALKDDYFTSRKLYPNVDFYSGLIYRAFGFPTDMFPVLFCIPRAAGWLAHWRESLSDSEFRIVRPRQKYVGPMKRDFVAMDGRADSSDEYLEYSRSMQYMLVRSSGSH